MSFDRPGAAALDYEPYRLEGSKLVLRGPQNEWGDRFLACLGGTDTFGKFVGHPYPVLMNAGIEVCNFGVMNAGLDSFLQDDALLDIAATAELHVIEAFDPLYLSNPYYTVHPRRNDRFLRATPLLAGLYPDVDFTEYNFVRHLVEALHRRCAARHAQMLDDIRRLWGQRMRLLLRRLGGVPAILLRLPMDGRTQGVTTEMIAPLEREGLLVLDVPVTRGAGPDGLQRLTYVPGEEEAARQVLSAADHRRIALQLDQVIQRML